MKNPLGVSPSKGYQGTTRGKEKILMTSVGIEPTTSGLDLPLQRIHLILQGIIPINRSCEKYCVELPLYFFYCFAAEPQPPFTEVQTYIFEYHCPLGIRDYMIMSIND